MSIGTIYRFYPDPEKDRHYTVVLTKSGSYLEVNNPDKSPGESKDVFPTLDAWREARYGLGADTILRMTTNAIIQGGFNIPHKNEGAGKWFRWCYKTISEASPELLTSQEVVKAFNALVEICSKYPDLRAKSDDDVDHAFIWDIRHWPWEDFSVKFKEDDAHEKYNSARAEILPTFRILRDLIKPKLYPYLRKKTSIDCLKRCIKSIQKNICHEEEVLKRIVARRSLSINNHKHNLKRWIEEYKELTGVDIDTNILI